MEIYRYNFAMGLAATLLLLAAPATAQVRGAVQSAQPNLPTRALAPSNVYYPAPSGYRYSAQSPRNAAVNAQQQAVFGAQRASNNGPIVGNSPNGYAAPAPIVGNAPNGYAAPAPIVGNAPNGYAAPAPIVGNAPNGYAAPVPTADPTAMCDAKWRAALRREVMNADDWTCSTRTAADGSAQACVITGPSSASVFRNVSTCGWRMPTFCDNTVVDLMTSLNKPSATNNPTPAGYTLVAGSGYYRVHTDPLPWDAARTACETEAPGAHLAMPVTAADYQAILDLVNAALPSQTLGAWVGFNDIAVEGSFVTVTGQPTCMLGNVVYFGGSPNNYGGNENCLALGYAKEASMNDYPCALPLPYVCEVTLPALTAPC